MAGSKGAARGSHSPKAAHKGVKHTKSTTMNHASDGEHGKDHMKAKVSKKHATTHTKLSGGKMKHSGGAKERIMKRKAA